MIWAFLIFKVLLYLWPMSLEKPKIDESFRILHAKAHEYITDQQELLEEQHAFGQFSSYTVDWENNIISFSNEDNSNLNLAFQIVGSLDPEKSIWTWRWDNTDISEAEKEELDIIKNYGEFYDFGYLSNPKLEIDTPIAWALTAISGYLRISKGIFRIQKDAEAQFVYFKEVLA